MVGLDRDRRLRIWLEEKADDAPGVEVGDPANPVALRGSHVEIIPTDAGLTATRRKEQVPGAIMLLDSKPTMRFVRFYNRGKPGARPWPSMQITCSMQSLNPSRTTPSRLAMRRRRSQARPTKPALRFLRASRFSQASRRLGLSRSC